MTNKDKILKRFEALKESILSATDAASFENESDKKSRIKQLLDDYASFCEYYFPHYCTAPTAYFQKKVFRKAILNPNKIYLLQWSREFAKSVHANILFPIFLKCKGELTGMIIGCANYDSAAAKLSDIQAEFESNQRLIADYGEQISFGNWEEGNFSCKDKVFFRAFGRSQSPRGVRFRHNRPNYGCVDDIDDKKLVKNDDLSKENYEWVKEEFMAALSIKKWWLFVPENKFHKNTVTARFENDQEVNTYLSQVNLLDENGQSNWPENYSTEECLAKIKSLGSISSQREYFNNPIEEGTIFKEEQFEWIRRLPFKSYDYLITYTDPSYKSTDKSDYKATILLGKKGIEYHVLLARIDKVSISTMFEWMYDISNLCGDVAVVHYMESVFLQDMMWNDLKSLSKSKGYMLPVAEDKRKKPDKFQRIEALSPLFERAVIKFNAAEQNSPGMILLKNQFLGFEKGSRVNDDGPDGVEGGIFILNQKTLEAIPPVIGQRKKSKKRY